ncbi:M20/M25/M40 family metallo-hydrolase [Leptolyngbya sp. FACHB-711]|uniref:M20/M25/M40 family metallo-hydrolase n=1 Tax=unclassified Leptolyngbya TaxID=2650499 RepID=UPI001688C963|nr:M20/M25/M40 family metallo-hydrolase [Leptolyngbya sp. FACHB-711]MBD1849679.1 M20/M25/M40 family metallo-hydrolase [Cyanobacteria bacterium FACHB-502]MBD2024230.1 M20/M25/M40 family metallo-hydrolase [Leptolyngbya sp. FACHB-711]
MRRRWLGVLLFLVTIAAVLLGWGLHPQRFLPLAREVEYSSPFRVSSDMPLVLPRSNSDRLIADVEQLAFVRHEAADRARARSYIMQQLQSAGWQVQEQPFGEGGVNLVAERPGNGSTAGVILLGAHYDTVEDSPGADDNATAVATLLETARLFQQKQTPRSLRLVFFDLEEAGLLGSEAYVQQLQSEPTFDGAVILDMLGYACQTPGCQTFPSVLPIAPPTDRGNFLGVIGDQGHPALTQSFTDANRPNLPQVLTLSVPTMGRFTPDLVRSDHAPFWRSGRGAVLVTDTANFRNPHYHQPSDTPETIDRDFFLGSAQTVINAIAILLQGAIGN